MGEPAEGSLMARNLALEAVRVTEAAALAAARFIGSGDEMAAERAAAEAMRAALDALAMDGVVVIGDEDSPLQVGTRIGAGGTALDVALDPLEGSTITVKGGNNALSVIALARQGGFLTVPDIYMEKVAVAGDLPPGLVDLDATPEDNVRAVARAKGLEVSDLQVCILDRPRHEELIGRVREAGARVMLISDGDISGVIATALPRADVDLYMGIGGAPQGVLAAVALRCMGGQMQGRLVVRSDEDRARAARCGITDWGRKYTLEEMARGDVMLAATGVTRGAVLRGCTLRRGHAVTNSLVMRSRSGTVRYVQAHHDLRRKAVTGCG